jgi:hypothetical protein
MNKDWISFELVDDGKELDIHGDPAGLRRLAGILERLASLPKSDHEHLMTPEWAGDDSVSEPQGGWQGDEQGDRPVLAGMSRSPNPRLQRTRLRSPLSRNPFGDSREM